MAVLVFLQPSVLPCAFRRSVTLADQENDDTVYILGYSPDNGVFQRVVRLSLNTLEEETIIETHTRMPCGMVRVESMFSIFTMFCFIKLASYLQIDFEQLLEVHIY